MRRLAVILTLCLTAVAAAACGNGSASSLPQVSGRFGADPSVTLPSSHPPSALKVQTISTGSGPVVHLDDYVLFNVVAKVWAGDRLVIDSFLQHQPQALALRTGLPAWQRLAGQRVGSRVLMIVPPQDGFGSRGDPSINVSGHDTLVFVFDILKALPDTAHAAGTALPYVPGPSLPTVTSSASGFPTIHIPAHTKPPTSLVSRVLVQGHGAPVKAGQTIVTQYTGLLWRTGREFNSSWAQGSPQSFLFTKSQLIKGWRLGLTGQRVGSRLLLVIPPSLGYGKAGNPPLVKGTDTLVYVVDILAALPN